MLILKGGWYSLRSEPTQTACEDTLGRIAVLRLIIRNLRQTLSISSALSPHISVASWINSHSTYIHHYDLLTRGLRSLKLFQAATKKSSWLHEMSKSFPITGIVLAPGTLPERQDIDLWFSICTSRTESLQPSLLDRALLLLMESSPDNELSFFSIAD